MNRPLPAGDRGSRSTDSFGASGYRGTVPCIGRLVGGTAPAEPVRVGPRCATRGPRAFALVQAGFWAKSAVNVSGAGSNRGNKQKSPLRAEPSGPRGRDSILRRDAVRALAALRFVGLHCEPGLLHRTGHKPA